MSRFILLIIVLLLFTRVMGQTNSGYFGNKVFIGWDKPIRLLGIGGKVLAGASGTGRIRLEKLINEHRMYGFSYERNKFSINDKINIYIPSGPSRSITSKSYSAFLKGFNKYKGMAPLGNYYTMCLIMNRNSVDSSNSSGGTTKQASFGDISFGFDFGRAFPLIGNRIIANFAIGLNLRFIQIGAGRRSYYLPDMYTNVELNQAIYNKNILKANFGISCALF